MNRICGVRYVATLGLSGKSFAILVTEACHQMVITESDSLHKGVTDGGTNEIEAALF